MKVPTWGTVVGVLMIVFGGCSVLGDIQSIYLPAELEKERAKLEEKIREEKEEREEEEQEEAEERIEIDSTKITEVDSTTAIIEEAAASEEDVHREKGLEMAEKFLNMSEETMTWMVRFGYIGVVTSLLYLLAGIFLLVPKEFSIKLAYGALILSITAAAAQMIILTTGEDSSGFIAMISGFSQIFGVIIDIILLAVIYSSDKEAYNFGPPTS